MRSDNDASVGLVNSLKSFDNMSVSNWLMAALEVITWSTPNRSFLFLSLIDETLESSVHTHRSLKLWRWLLLLPMHHHGLIKWFEHSSTGWVFDIWSMPYNLTGIIKPTSHFSFLSLVKAYKCTWLRLWFLPVLFDNRINIWKYMIETCLRTKFL